MEEEEDVEFEEWELVEFVDLVVIGQIERSREKQREREKQLESERSSLGFVINVSLFLILVDLVVFWLFG